MIKSLVTGGAGFLGSHISRELAALGHSVVILDDLSGGFVDNVPPGTLFVKGSITDHALLNHLFREHKFDYVYHLAAYAAEGLSHFIKRFNYNNNLIGSVNLINESVKYKIKCFVFTSSIAVYGEGQLPMTEELTPLPEDPYGISKYAVELELRSTHNMFGLNYVIFRPHNVYGEYQNLGDKYRNVVGIFMNQLMQGKPITIFGDGSQTRAFSYVGDVAPHIARSVNVMEAYNQVFNVGADKWYSINELSRAVCKAINIKGEIKHLPPRQEVSHAYADHNKAKKVFGNITETSLDQGLHKMAEWALRAGIRKSTNFSEIEIMEKMPVGWLDVSK